MVPCTAQKMKFSIKVYFSKCNQIRRKLRIWSQLLKKSSMENLIFCAVFIPCYVRTTRAHLTGVCSVTSLDSHSCNLLALVIYFITIVTNVSFI